MKDRIEKMYERWFIMEPPLFQVLCLHELCEETQMKCALRCGRRRLEYNPALVASMTDAQLEEAVKAEAIRMLLKHPYDRVPDHCCMLAAALGSNVTISDNYAFHNIPMEKPADFRLPPEQYYEWYAMKIQELLPKKDMEDTESGTDGQSAEADDNDNDAGNDTDVMPSDERHADKRGEELMSLAELWEEDEFMVSQINHVIESVREWGSLPGSLKQILKASLKARINWRNVLAGFRASVLSSHRKLTRMRPNRRTGFAAMGSVRKFNTRLLIAVDVSGSISDASLSNFFGVVNSAFRYGFESVDVLQFDDGIQGVMSLNNAMKKVAVQGRGGTSFQEPVDYAHEHGYEGLVILTDGCAQKPEVPLGMRTKILWACVDRDAYEEHREWMAGIGRVCVIQI